VKGPYFRKEEELIKHATEALDTWFQERYAKTEETDAAIDPTDGLGDRVGGSLGNRDRNGGVAHHKRPSTAHHTF